jgi:Asp-tRNA(Asn)/Glu-tRNA(Gln) amidotransferase A subunit family amidase
MYPTGKYDYTPYAAGLKTTELKDFKYADYLLTVYNIISSAEFSANMARFDGIKFGYRTENFKNLNDMVINSRSESFDTRTKLTALMGAYVLSEAQFGKYYLKAAKIRRLIKQELDEIFKVYDLIITPVAGASTALANLTGCPSITMRDMHIIAKEFDENKLFAFGKEL